MPSLKEVFEALTEENEYSSYWDKMREAKGEPESKMDRNKPVEAWILWAEEELDKAREEAYKDVDKTKALHHCRKAANLMVCALMHVGCPRREKRKS